ncbi:hypothetical protein [Curtobacterium sp. MEB011]|uniref:hypothetical protein n=1 Tax=Curtobacterium sp. MEB011 TaxID=3040285 RepID=UPI00255060A6|nr:hypothetical protein [Curtobacterium sp. MEB011]
MTEQASIAPPQAGEPTVQVPVSLIERLLGNRTTDTWNELRALLSQPTPSAVLTGGIGYPVREAARREDEHARSVATADPPSIEDMVPGTTFTAGWPHTGRPTHWVVLNDGVRCIEHGRGYYGTAWSLHDAPIDPSTIRDVTPPRAG